MERNIENRVDRELNVAEKIRARFKNASLNEMDAWLFQNFPSVMTVVEIK